MVAGDRGKEPLFQAVEATLQTLLVHLVQGPWFDLQESNQLGRGHLQRVSGRGQVVVMLLEHIEGFGQERGEIVVFRTDAKGPSVCAGEPTRARNRLVGPRLPDVQRQIDAQSRQGHPAILVLAAALRRFPLNTAGVMGQHDCRFHLVAVLATRSGPSRAPHVAVGQQFVRSQFARVEWHDRTSNVFRRNVVQGRASPESSERGLAPGDAGPP